MLLAGCTSTSNMALKTLHDSVFSAPDVVMTDQQIAQLTYAASYMRMGDAPQAFVVLAKAEGHDRLWLSEEKEAVVTRFGHIVRTDGLSPVNIEAVRFVKGDPLEKGLVSLKQRNYQANGLISSMPDYQFDLPFSADYQVKGSVPVVIANKTQNLTQVDEHYSIPALDFSVVNHYWLNDRGVVFKSQQQLLPTLPMITITTLKPYIQDLQ
ncbi:YjbF family lipoprotein [Marinomonas arenicola]